MRADGSPNTPTPGIRRPQILLILTTLAAGLAVDVRTDLAGQIAVGAACWAILPYLLGRLGGNERRAMMACLVIATAGELFCSLAWGLYTYRLGNVPLFVPPGHVMMFLLGFSLSRRLSERAANAVIGCAGAYALAAAATGFDTFGVPLFLVLAAASLAMPRQRRLYASTFVLSLVLELYGTWLGNWTWAPHVPWTGLATTNPPGTVGAFYSALDAMVAASALFLAPRLSARAT